MSKHIKMGVSFGCCRMPCAGHILAAVTVFVFALAVPVHAGGTPCEPFWDQTPGQPGFNGWVYGIKALDFGAGDRIYAGGLYTEAGGQPANSIAEWDGRSWSALGDGVNERVFAIEKFDDGTGPALYIAGNFTMSGDTPINYIARWDPTTETWSEVGGGLNGAVLTMLVYDDGSGSALYVGGDFTTAGGKPAARIARWDGTAWTEIGGGIDAFVRAMVVYNDGSGPDLYVGGIFSVAGGKPGFNRAARWDGETWSPLGVGLEGQGIRAMALYDDGSGPTLIAGGLFTHAGGQIANNIAQWNFETESWSTFGSGTNERVVGMHVFDDGSGQDEQLYVGGWFTMMDGQPVNRLVRWDGTSWTQPGAGTNMVVRSLTAAQMDGEDAPSLFIGGGFTQVAGEPAAYAARWFGCPDAALPTDLNGDGSVDVLDLLALLGAWGPCGKPGDCPADLNGDGAVDVLDMLVLLGAWSGT